MRKRWWWVLAGVVVLGGAVTFAVLQRGPRPTQVQMTKIGKEDLQAKVSANGNIQAQKKVDISATIPGQITHLAVEEGDVVTKGEFLLEIDPVNARAAARSSEAGMNALLQDVEAARASLAQARFDFERAEENFRARILSAADHERARTALATAEATVQAAERRVEQARATLEGARNNLAKTVVRAPMDGIVTARRVEEGEVAVIGVQNSPGTVLLTISDMSVVEAEMEVDETSIPSVQVAQKARVRVDAYPNKTFDGVVTEVGSSPILQAGSVEQAIKFKVKIQIKNPPAGIKPGLSVQADILTGFRAKAIAVPLQALVVRDAERKPGETPGPGAARDEEGVYVADKGKARFQPVRTGLIGEMSIEVVEGLQGGETVVSGPFRALREMKPGDAVAEEKEPAGGGATTGAAR